MLVFVLAISMHAFADVQALVFDVFGTVVDWRSGRHAGATPRFGARAVANGGGCVKKR